ncbi:hypothetical protein [Streptomyces sp. NPDC057682]|uniref:hypothetical protein n=1 Tax=Streptomyces sp. NPDC057682 TaxID=3346210 RepID=UPI003680554A
MSDWGSFVDEGPSQAVPRMPERPPEPAAPPYVPPAADDGWGVFADGPEVSGASAAPAPVGPPVPAPGVAVPSPEAVASLLTEGEHLWAYVDGGGAAHLGSGCALTVVQEDGGGDGFTGWRPVVVVDPAALTVRPVPLALADPPVGAATSVSALYRDPEPPTAPVPDRAAAFPAGRGPDLDALLAAAVAEEREKAAAGVRREREEAAAALQQERDRLRAGADEAARQAQGYAESQIRAAQDAARQGVQEAQQSAWQWQQRAQAAEAEVVRLDTELQRGGWRRWRSGGSR